MGNDMHTHLLTADAQRLARAALWLRLGLGGVWLWSGIVSEFVAPRAVSLGLLADVGVTGDIAPWLLRAASLLDVLVGVVTLLGLFTRWVAVAQAAVIVAYTALLVGHAPSLWAHPFAPIGKNIALVAAALALSTTGGGAWSADAWVSRRRV
ncbi:MAG: DoxX-like family protein [Chloroflexota bacterium]